MALQYITQPRFAPSSPPTQIPSADTLSYSLIPKVHRHCLEFSSFGCSQGFHSYFRWPLFQCKVLREGFCEYPTWNKSLQTKLPDVLFYFYFLYLSLSEILHICVYASLCVYIHIFYIHTYICSQDSPFHTVKNDPAPNVNSDETGKHWFKVHDSLTSQ